jgi:hypothetical protein
MAVCSRIRKLPRYRLHTRFCIDLMDGNMPYTYSHLNSFTGSGLFGIFVNQSSRRVSCMTPAFTFTSPAHSIPNIIIIATQRRPILSPSPRHRYHDVLPAGVEERSVELLFDSVWFGFRQMVRISPFEHLRGYFPATRSQRAHGPPAARNDSSRVPGQI